MTAPSPMNMPGAQQQTAPQASTAPPAQPAEQTPPAAPAAPAAPAPAAQQPPAAPAPDADAPKPPWEASGETFDPERAWNLIQNVKNENAQLKGKLADAQPVLDAAEQSRRDEQGELATVREDLTNAHKATDTWRNRAVTAEARVLASDKFVDADTVLALVGDLSEFVAGDNIDTNKLQQRLDQLATDKPFLVKQAAAQGFTPNRGQGQSGTGQVPIDAQIEAAQKAGNIQLAIALKQQRYAQQAQR